MSLNYKDIEISGTNKITITLPITAEFINFSFHIPKRLQDIVEKMRKDMKLAKKNSR